ncbi:MAG: molecular chaperone [Desulfonatronovibrio sp.]
MHEIASKIKTAEGLRDYFISENSQAMKNAWETLSQSVTPKLPGIQDWDEAEFSFNRLFTGPKALEAPPYASVYLQNEPNLMGETTLYVRWVYQQMGLVSPWKNTLPDDHISLELDAVLIIHKLSLEHDSQELKDLSKSFILEHFCVWVPQFCQKILNSQSCHKTSATAAELLNKLLETDLAKG